MGSLWAHTGAIECILLKRQAMQARMTAGSCVTCRCGWLWYMCRILDECHTRTLSSLLTLYSSVHLSPILQWARRYKDTWHTGIKYPPISPGWIHFLSRKAWRITYKTGGHVPLTKYLHLHTCTCIQHFQELIVIVTHTHTQFCSVASAGFLGLPSQRTGPKRVPPKVGKPASKIFPN